MPDQLVEWIDDKAKKENRSRNDYIEKILWDLKDGRLAPLRSGGEEEVGKARLPPSART